jgi:Family of unknown function (DUF5682)
MGVHIFGIRHHGPGSARSLRQALETLQPDMILVEGPPDAAEVLPLLAHAQMRPPVAILIYRPDQPQSSVYYPFAVFSPEWQALHYGLNHQIPVRFMDLPQAHRFALNQPADSIEDGSQDQDKSDVNPDESLETIDQASDDNVGEASAPELTPIDAEPPSQQIRHDPLGWLSRVAGYDDSERWWDQLVEQRQDSTELFSAILEMMTALRREADAETKTETEQARQSSATATFDVEALREAYMRKTIREAETAGHQRIAVICGAWHAPALAEMPTASSDLALLKKLPKVKVEATWVPWTHGRLSYHSGYGAGIESPGWYHHLWTVPDRVVIRWMARVAALLRHQDLDASSATVIEAVRLSEALAALRGRPLPSLEELNEATQTLFCFGDPLPMQLIYDQLIVGEDLGEVPDETPMVPLQQDLIRQQKRLRLKPEARESNLDLDLRQPIDLERSALLHRLSLLSIDWGQPGRSTGQGTFRELWQLRWQPEYEVKLIEVGIWGNTIQEAAQNCVKDKSNRADLPTLTRLLEQTLTADLPSVISFLMMRLQAEAALASDIAHLMLALPPLVNVVRYGNVRQTDTGAVSQVVQGLISRICVGLPTACGSLNDEAATQMDQQIVSVNQQVLWQEVLLYLTDQQGLHGLLAGRCCRLLLDAGILGVEEVARRLGLALSIATDPLQSAAWVEGLLKGSGLLLLHDQALWSVIDQWITSLPADLFTVVLPLLRRTFATFSAPERRQMGERVKRGGSSGVALPAGNVAIDVDRADQVLPLLGQLLGLTIALDTGGL